MSEANKAMARRAVEEILPACDVDGMRAISYPDIEVHGRRPDEPPGVEGVIRTMLWLGRVFSDQRWEIRNVIGDGDLVAVHATHHARHTGELMGIPPTGRVVAYDYVHIFRFRDGKAVEYWSVRDSMAFMQQLGVMGGPQPAGAAAG